MVGVGIIGCGKIAQVCHIPEYAENSSAFLKGFYNRSVFRAEEMVKKYGGRVYNTPEEMFSNSEIDAVSICTPNSLHAELSIKALTAGKHVLCEKPMAVCFEDCEKMVNASKKSGKILMICHSLRFSSPYIKAKELIENGEIGKVLSFRAVLGHSGPENWSVDRGKDLWFFKDESAGMGALADLGIHKTDIIEYLTGEKIVRVTAKLSNLDKCDGNGNPISVDDNAISIFELSNGGVGTVTASWNYYGESDNSTVIYGTKGVMHIFDNPKHPLYVTLSSGEKVYYNCENQKNTGVIDHFIDCIENGKEPISSGRSALSAMKAIFASAQSSKTGKSIDIK